MTRTLGDHQVFRFEGTLECSSLTDGFAVTGEDVDTGFRTTGYFLNEDATLGTRQEVMLVARC
ncbi:hypothetical protein [Streptomyces sp. NBC_00568]|uniref:hypothetical protein n=1 Tax=Streptomyces sp. NBC_00568 TaxID=2975779 RepID=UPI002252283B|nr:hypothetical protein [Streptomyces sp. NBC_00568]MCX4993654.1 hypothetical protein [Streptomyces sp. NBC_00568]